MMMLLLLLLMVLKLLLMVLVAHGSVFVGTERPLQEGKGGSRGGRVVQHREVAAAVGTGHARCAQLSRADARARARRGRVRAMAGVGDEARGFECGRARARHRAGSRVDEVAGHVVSLALPALRLGFVTLAYSLGQP